MSQFSSEVSTSAQRVESELGLPSGFLEALQEEDDWSFLVKTHALVEAAAAHALVAMTGITSAHDFFSRLDLSSSKTGKVSLAKALGLLSSEERRFIRSLSELRNFFVHDVRNVGVSFDEYFSGLSKQKRMEYGKAFCYVDLNHPQIEVSDGEAVERLLSEPKRFIWSAAMVIVAVLQLQVETRRFERDAEDHIEQVAARLGPRESEA